MDRGLRQQLRAVVGWVLLAPFLLLSLLPSGVMPAHAADGTLTLVLCTEDGPVERTIDLATGAPVEQAPADSRGCDWACGVFAVALAVQPVAPCAPDVLAQRAKPAPPPALLAAALATGLPPATGPPAVV